MSLLDLLDTYVLTDIYKIVHKSSMAEVLHELTTLRDLHVYLRQYQELSDEYHHDWLIADNLIL